MPWLKELKRNGLCHSMIEKKVFGMIEYDCYMEYNTCIHVSLLKSPENLDYERQMIWLHAILTDFMDKRRHCWISPWTHTMPCHCNVHLFLTDTYKIDVYQTICVYWLLCWVENAICNSVVTMNNVQLFVDLVHGSLRPSMKHHFLLASLGSPCLTVTF